jgi:hypothetical protein
MANVCSKAILHKEIEHASLRHRSSILRWMYEHISNEERNEECSKIEETIREINGTCRGFKRNKESSFLNFIKVVHSHELITAANLRSVLRHPEVMAIYNANLQICDKQAAPLGRTLCNFTEVACQVKSSMSLPDHSTCSCRNNPLLHKTDDLADGHVVTADPMAIKDLEIRKLFMYGSKFRHNMSTDTIMESLALGLDDYIAKTLRKNRNNEQLAKTLEKWRDICD